MFLLSQAWWVTLLHPHQNFSSFLSNPNRDNVLGLAIMLVSPRAVVPLLISNEVPRLFTTFRAEEEGILTQCLFLNIKIPKMLE